MYAVSGGSTQSVPMLPDSGADVNVMRLSQKRSLVPAGDAGCHCVLRSTDAGRSDDNVILVKTSNESEIVRLEQGTEINQRSSNLNTPLTLAVEANHAEIVRLLIHHGADTNYLRLPPTVSAENGLPRP